MVILMITLYVIIGIVVFVAYGIYQERDRKGEERWISILSVLNVKVLFLLVISLVGVRDVRVWEGLRLSGKSPKLKHR